MTSSLAECIGNGRLPISEAATDNAQPTEYAPHGGSWLTCLVRLSEELPPKSTPSQLAFFLAAAKGDLLGQPRTHGDIRAELMPGVNRKFAVTYRLFMNRPLRRTDYVSTRIGLGWLWQDEDPLDGRRKPLRLTPLGREVLARVFRIAIDPNDENALNSRLRIAIEAVFVL
ncbi:hypothetical protein [Novosphingobium panipatense]|uniref:Winged helix DNA-binding protein n=1 Tax=Novosphingobium panipatense TaxID=428991 RepID=A0ABY1Q2R6_9SPHN|nr:hypothetical protein [Novosphingobium panipatense]SMP53004.1 hypothetical protein SAMN06296065_101354 [Novosphingobium panipatense]